MNSMATFSWTEIAECSACGSLVVSQAAHLKWHQAVSSGEQTHAMDEIAFIDVADPLVSTAPPAPDSV